ncbi:hypothetical protein BCR35DRAFT_297929 [Leucosporidium creatinivorum]|uniref:Uncharacterized protein n=1 Tax=Leucosporidium creatinivorum TaxID=106004 RepID=A0A1Y2G3I9_9BASI|nr:hypothetical protein BCR35DRAFT_297929 [Leucosporidium creatinivorum]
MSSAAPALPARPTPARQDSTDVQGEADPPPAYEAHPSVQQEQTLELGPSRPFHPPPHAPPPQQQQQYAAPSSPPPNSTLPPPAFPFWNGASLTPAQTGFSDGPVQAMYGAPQQPPFQAPHSTGGSWTAPYQAPQPTGGSYYLPHTSSPPPPQHPTSFAPPPGPPPLPSRPSAGPNPVPQRATGYSPTTQPTNGQPYLNQGRLLVYPPGHKCHKCSNTGFKPFGGGRAGDDPSHPCRKDWDKYSKPFTGALAISARDPPSNYQRPLRLPPPPPPRPPPQQHAPMMYGPPQNVRLSYNPPPGALVLRPGDPRMGGRLCPRCGGDGLVMGFLFDEDTCPVCQGAGRVF